MGRRIWSGLGLRGGGCDDDDEGVFDAGDGHQHADVECGCGDDDGTGAGGVCGCEVGAVWREWVCRVQDVCGAVYVQVFE